MGDYNRLTKEIKLEELPPEMKAALNEHIGKYELGPILGDALMCVESTAEKIKKGLFGGSGAKVVKMALILGSHRLSNRITTLPSPAPRS